MDSLKKFIHCNNPDTKSLMAAAVKLAYEFINKRHAGLSPRDLISLGHFLFGLSKFPMAIKGLNVEFGLYLKDGDDSFSEKVFLGFTICEECFKWKHSIHTYQKEIGSDSMIMSWYELYTNGTEDSENINNIEQTLEDYINEGASLYLDDMSKLDMDELHEYDN